MGNMYIFSLSVEPEFNQVLEKVDKIIEECGGSRSEIIRTILYEYFSVVPKRVELQKRISNNVTLMLSKERSVA